MALDRTTSELAADDSAAAAQQVPHGSEPPSPESLATAEVRETIAEQPETHEFEAEEYEPRLETSSNGSNDGIYKEKLQPANNLTRTTSTYTTATTATSATGSSYDVERIESKDPNINKRWYRWLLLKRRHVPPVPKERIVSREVNANLLSIVTWQWMNPLMDVGYQRPLEYNDLWIVNPKRSADILTKKLAINFDRRVKKGTSRPLVRAIVDTFFFEFWLGGICQLIASVVQIINPFLLRYLITFASEAYFANIIGTPAPPVAHGVGLVFAVTIMQVIQSGCTNQFLYRGMMNGGQARAALIAIIFDKSLTISNRAKAGTKPPEDAESDDVLPEKVEAGSEAEKSWFKRQLEKRRGKDKDDKKTKEKKASSGSSEGWSNGRIINLMSVDTYRVDQASGMFHMIWTSPVAILVTLVLLLINLSYSALAGFGLLIVAMPVLGRAIRVLFRRRAGINKLTDQRVSLTQEILASVRFVKYFGWETSFLDRIGSIRDREISSIQILLAIRNGINAISMSMPIFASMLSFICYALTSHQLNPAYIFSSLALFNSLRLPLNLLPLVIGQVVDAASSLNRIEEFLLAEDTKDEAAWDLDAKNAIEMKDGSFVWERTRKKDGEDDENSPPKGSKGGKPAKKNDKKAKKQKLNENPLPKAEDEKAEDSSSHEADQRQPFAISDIDLSIGRNELVAVIGNVGSGKSSLLAAMAGDMRKTAGQVTLGATRAFCPQYAWIQNTTVKENILFGKDMDPAWYNKVIDACALRPDLEMLPNGDLTEIGERGITVSGGQKQRLNIARAIYFDSDIILMDDPLSAVDAHVGRHIMDHAITGLLKDKCRVLATHQLWVLDRCDRIVWMDEGRIIAVDTFDNLMANNPSFVKLIANNAQEKKEDEKDGEGEKDDKDREGHKKKKSKKHGPALMQVEERAVKSVSWEVYSAYVKASGSIFVAPLVLSFLILSQGANIVTSLWLSWWTSGKWGLKVGQYIGVYAGLGAVQMILLFLFSVALSVYGTRSSKVMLNRALTRVLRAPMSFFDTTPLGRITNRFSKDIDTMDNVLSDSMRFFLITMGMIISVFILIIVYFYYFAIALGPLAILFVFSANFYRSSAREVKRHESVLRSHVFARFGEAVTGIATIRAYGLQKRFSKTIRDAIDDMNSAYYLTFSNQRWLSVRLDIIGNLLVFTVGILVVTSRFTVNPSTGGLVLSYILSIVQMIQFTVRQLAEVENNMNATERIHYYGTALEEEPPLKLGPVPDNWPQHGEIEFKDVEMRYRPGLPLVLRGLNMHVAGGERIGIVGRTGAGKSSIMSTLFRLVELSGGSISIDGIDISRIGLSDLRSRLAIIPQDPTLFRGTVRSNLDPFNKYTDIELWSALRQADLVGDDVPLDDKTQGRIHLDSAVEEEGLNFSLGQRQLMALARALVRGSQIIVCDEATSSVDMETDQKIQKTIAEGFKGKTLLCIAHRLKTIIKYDRICVMDNGTIAELDTPIRLFESGGIFAQMCWKSNIKAEDFFD